MINENRTCVICETKETNTVICISCQEWMETDDDYTYMDGDHLLVDEIGIQEIDAKLDNNLGINNE